ncbi:MAG: PfkB [Candidatus Uhrbacteria bacterium GW2011_GWF2_39_13]|uniref:PfkB n=1 Tax=Candidatus Uhrbacteria bacterium GW2011_GWF2_39_13 TaxID=1618995 RepID=A0A0G0ML34_9BACT|nr:MAG: PfkB [Candidatus Uhrbacteria bacterium GW2011_GWF2_39_13]
MEFHSDIIGIGYCSVDYLCLVPYIPQDDKVEIIQTIVQGGGPAATAIVAAARLGAKTALISTYGDDERGKSIRDGLAAEGINIKAMKLRKGTESPAAFCWIEKAGGKRSIVWTKGNVEALSPDEVDIEMIKKAKVLHLDGHQTEAAIAAAQIARKNKVTVSIDAGTIVPGIEKLLGLSDIIIASEKFALRYTGEADMEDAAKKLFKFNCIFSAVTMGEKGSIGFDGKNILRCPAFKVHAIDTTGAGDVFHGAFIYKYLSGGNWTECINFASAVSALKCTKFGGRTGIPRLSETEKFLSEKGF